MVVSPMWIGLEIFWLSQQFKERAVNVEERAARGNRAVSDVEGLMDVDQG